MGKIIISRVQEWNNRFRQFGIYVDGQKIGTIANGEIKTFEIPDGTHSIKAKIDWCGSRQIDFSVSAEEKKYFRLSGYALGKIIIPYAFVVLILNFVASKYWEAGYVAWFFLPVFPVIFYYLTLGKNEYLRLDQTESW